jgi:hypothetical protein
MSNQTEVRVTELPPCDFCGKPAYADAKTKHGPWANMCHHHYVIHTISGIGFGTGKGQRFVLIPKRGAK